MLSWPHLAALSQAGSRSLGPGREGGGWKGGIPRSRKRGGGAVRGRNPKKAKPAKAFCKFWYKKNKQHFVTIVTVTIYLTQVYIHFYLCNLCPSPTIHNCCARRRAHEIRTHVRADHLLTGQLRPLNSSSHRTHRTPEVSRDQNVWPLVNPGRRRGNITSFSFYFCPQTWLRMARGWHGTTGEGSMRGRIRAVWLGFGARSVFNPYMWPKVASGGRPEF